MRKILVAPLDWGLGHASRCIPIISKLMEHGCDVVLGGSGSSLALLTKEFPSLKALELPGYNPEYSTKVPMAWKMASQLPSFMSTIRREQKAVNKLVQYGEVDMVISDNRFGCYSPDVPSVFITHQSNILMPRRFGWLGPLVRMMNHQFINKYHYCWIPDYPHTMSMAGSLISFGKNNIKTRIEYIGSLSRFVYKDVEKQYDIVALCSGPEPQRSVFENILREHLSSTSLTYLLVRGKVNQTNQQEETGSGTVVDYLTTAALQEILPSAKLIICRSGYSSIMDLQALQARAVFIPTPGQTEQEYLAHRLMERKIAFSTRQEKFDLQEAIAQSKQYTGFTPRRLSTGNLLDQAIKNLLSTT